MPELRQAKLSDAGAIAAIYQYYVQETVISFEYEIVSIEAMSARIQRALQTYDWWVLEDNGQILGYAYYGKFREREAYAATVETSVYLDRHSIGKGYGLKLYRALLASIHARGFREVIACVALPNLASEKLHDVLGFQKVGHLPAVGYKFSRYIDVGFWQLSMQHYSPTS